MSTFYDSFFQEGWNFFYKLTMTLLRILAPRILEADELGDILSIIAMDSKTMFGDENEMIDDQPLSPKS